MSWSLDTAASQQTTASNPSMPLVSTGVGTILEFPTHHWLLICVDSLPLLYSTSSNTYLLHYIFTYSTRTK